MCGQGPLGAHAREQIPGESPTSPRWLAQKNTPWPLGCWLWALKSLHRISPWIGHLLHQLDKLSLGGGGPRSIDFNPFRFVGDPSWRKWNTFSSSSLPFKNKTQKPLQQTKKPVHALLLHVKAKTRTRALPQDPEVNFETFHCSRETDKGEVAHSQQDLYLHKHTQRISSPSP